MYDKIRLRRGGKEVFSCDSNDNEPLWGFLYKEVWIRLECGVPIAGEVVVKAFGVQMSGSWCSTQVSNEFAKRALGV